MYICEQCVKRKKLKCNKKVKRKNPLLGNNDANEVPKVRIHFVRAKSKEKNYKRSVDCKDEDE